MEQNYRKIKIAGRDAKVQPFGRDAFEVAVYQVDGDCQKGKSESERYACTGKCNNELVSIVFQSDKLYVITGILPKSLPMIAWLDESVCATRGYSTTPEEHAALCYEIMRREKDSIKSILPENARVNYDAFLDRLGEGQRTANCIDSSKKIFVFTKSKNLGLIRVKIDNDIIVNLQYECSFLRHPMMAGLYAGYVSEVARRMDELKGVLPPPAPFTSPPQSR